MRPSGVARLAVYQPYHAARADLLARSGRVGEAVVAYDEAIALTTNPVEGHFLTEHGAASRTLAAKTSFRALLRSGGVRPPVWKRMWPAQGQPSPTGLS